MIRLFVLAVLCLAIPTAEVLASGQNDTSMEGPAPPPRNNPLEPSPVKNGTAAGRYEGGGGGYGQRKGGYGQGGYSSEESDQYEVAYGHSQRLVDDFICDLDASILVVTNSEKSYRKSEGYGQNGGDNGYGRKEEGYGKSGYAAGRVEPAAKRAKRGAGYGEERREEGEGYGQGYGGHREGYGQKRGYGGKGNSYSVAKAHRLRCSAIAVNSDEDCRKCCHMAARKERSISRESIVGFIVDYEEMRQSSSGYEPSGPYRMKRNAEPVYAPAAKPEDYQYGGMGGGNGYGKEQKQQRYGQETQKGYGQGEKGYGQGGGYGQKEERGQSYGGGYQQQSSYAYNYPERPKNPRCVCCAPKAYAPSSYGSNYGSGEKKERGGGYGSGEYGGEKEGSKEERPGYGKRREEKNGYGGSSESGERREGYGRGESREYGGPKPPMRHDYGRERGGGYGGGERSSEASGGYGEGKRGRGGYKKQGKKQRKEGGRKGGGPY